MITAGEAGASILYHTSSPVGKMSRSLKKVLYQKAVLGSCLDDQVVLIVHFGGRICSIIYQMRATEFCKLSETINLCNLLLKL